VKRERERERDGRRGGEETDIEGEGGKDGRDERQEWGEERGRE
jgi:hypothetical protein